TGSGRIRSAVRPRVDDGHVRTLAWRSKGDELHVIALSQGLDDLVGAAPDLLLERRALSYGSHLDVPRGSRGFADAVRTRVDDDGALQAGPRRDLLLVRAGHRDLHQKRENETAFEARSVHEHPPPSAGRVGPAPTVRS